MRDACALFACENLSGLNINWAPIILLGKMLLFALCVLGFILLVVLYIIWGLRRAMGAVQSRIGPNRVGWQGLLQTPADALKLLQKEDIIPACADKWVFIIAPIVVFVPAYAVYAVMPFSSKMIASDLNIGILYEAAITGIGIIGIIMAGWASNNKWALLGAFRAAAQLVSFEVPMVLAFCVPVLLTGSLSLQEMVLQQGGVWGGFIPNWFIFQFKYWPIVPISLAVYFTSGLAEANLIPFDIMEAESELVSGYNVEYSGMKFALFFLAEFATGFTLAALATTMFLGGWQPLHPALGYPFLGIRIPALEPWIAQFIQFAWFFGKTLFLVIVLIWIRSTWPRVRVDQLLGFSWKVLLPVALGNLVLAGIWVALS